MNTKIENQIKELIKLIVTPITEMDNCMDDYYRLSEELEFPESSGSHFDAESEMDSVMMDIESYEEEISPVLMKISALSNGAYEKDSVAYLKSYIDIPDCIEERINNGYFEC